MMPGGLIRQTTITERDDASASGPPASTALALRVAWCREEPWRAGEVILLVAAMRRKPEVRGRASRMVAARMFQTV
jgi:hypothetical protein